MPQLIKMKKELEIIKKVKDRFPPKVISRVELEGSEIIVYTKSEDFFRTHEQEVKKVVSEIKKRIEIRPESNLTLDQEATRKIKQKRPVIHPQKRQTKALEEFEKLHYTPGAPLEYLGKALVYKAQGEFEEEAIWEKEKPTDCSLLHF